MKKINGLSVQQKKCYKQICGYPYKDGEMSGMFMTNRPFNRETDLPYWIFMFVFHQDTGYLVCQLEHRMTNNRTFGWDRQGNLLEQEIIDKMYPPHL